MDPGSQEAAVAKPLAASPILDRRSEAFHGSSTVTGRERKELKANVPGTWCTHASLYIIYRKYTVDRAKKYYILQT